MRSVRRVLSLVVLVAVGLLASSGIHLRSSAARLANPVLLADEHGPIAVYPIPYLEPDLRWRSLDAAGPRHVAVLDAAMHQVRADLARRPGTRSIAVAHAFVRGFGPIDVCDSERDVSVGGSPEVPVNVFDGIDYVALGHLHGRQQPGRRAAYSGTPLAYSFSEANHTKSVNVVDLAADGTVTVSQLATPVPRPLAIVRATIDELLTDPRHAALEGAYLSITLTDEIRPRDPMARLRSRFPHVLLLGHEPPASTARASTYAERVRGRSDVEIALQFVADLRSTPATPAEAALLERAVDRVRTAAHDTGERVTLDEPVAS